jgi:hypothetical protein
MKPAARPFGQTDRLNAIHIITNRIKNVLGCIRTDTVIKNAPALKVIDFILIN